jgi:hypothetical protein
MRSTKESNKGRDKIDHKFKSVYSRFPSACEREQFVKNMPKELRFSKKSED